MTNLSTRSQPIHTDAFPRPVVSADDAKAHSDQRFDDRLRRDAHETSMGKIRTWTIAAIIAAGTILWVVFTT